jgi:hypothetical protein
MFRLFQSAALHGLTTESSAHVAEAKSRGEIASEFAMAHFKLHGASAARDGKPL